MLFAAITPINITAYRWVMARASQPVAFRTNPFKQTTLQVCLDGSESRITGQIFPFLRIILYILELLQIMRDPRVFIALAPDPSESKLPSLIGIGA